MTEIAIHCKFDEMIEIDTLKFNPKNANKHSNKQIERLAKILNYQGWRYPVKVSIQSGLITSGHGRVLAAKKLGLTSVPVNFQNYANEDMEIADLHADNEIARWAELDMSALNQSLESLDPSFDLDLLGIKNFSIDGASDISNEYSNKIESPIYKLKGEIPKIKDLFNREKTDLLESEIKNSTIPDEIKMFLIYAAQRHIVFNYEKIAEFYASTDKQTQNLMENSALVIIDFEKAIEKGFVKLTEDIAKAYNEDYR